MYTVSVSVETDTSKKCPIKRDTNCIKQVSKVPSMTLVTIYIRINRVGYISKTGGDTGKLVIF